MTKNANTTNPDRRAFLSRAASVAAGMSEKFANALRELELEGDICDLTRMARLAEVLVLEAVGGLAFENGKYIEVPDSEATELAMFTVTQMAVMAKRFEDLYFRLRSEARAGTIRHGPPNWRTTTATSDPGTISWSKASRPRSRTAPDRISRL